MKNGSVLFFCFIVLSGLGCSVAPNNSVTDNGSARFSGEAEVRILSRSSSNYSLQ